LRYSIASGAKHKRGKTHPIVNFRNVRMLSLRLSVLEEPETPLMSKTAAKGIATKMGDVLAKVPNPKESPEKRKSSRKRKNAPRRMKNATTMSNEPCK
jgi:hypothetical protein